MLTWSRARRALALGCIVSLCACGYDDSAYAPPEVTEQTGEEAGDATTTSTTPATSSGPAGASPPATSPLALAVVTAELPAGTVGAEYAAQLVASGGTTPYTWSIAAGQLPAGLSFAPSGAISGTPTAEGAFELTVQVQDASPSPQSATRTLSIVVSADLTITTSTLPPGTSGVRYDARVFVVGGAAPYTFRVSGGALPSGLALDPASGDVAGTPAAAGSYTATISVEDSSVPPNGAERVFTIEIR